MSSIRNLRSPASPGNLNSCPASRNSFNSHKILLRMQILSLWHHIFMLFYVISCNFIGYSHKISFKHFTTSVRRQLNITPRNNSSSLLIIYYYMSIMMDIKCLDNLCIISKLSSTINTCSVHVSSFTKLCPQNQSAGLM